MHTRNSNYHSGDGNDGGGRSNMSQQHRTSLSFAHTPTTLQQNPPNNMPKKVGGKEANKAAPTKMSAAEKKAQKIANKAKVSNACH
jgi:hypothetical protein